MKIHELRPSPGSNKKRKRVGRGSSSGMGKTSTRGMDGQNSRSGGGVRPGFEGGQMPLIRQLPKRGFTNIFAKMYTTVNVCDLEVFDDGTLITAQSLKEAGFIKKINDGLKVLGDGEITKKLDVKAVKFSKTAQEKILAAGGSIEVIG